MLWPITWRPQKSRSSIGFSGSLPLLAAHFAKAPYPKKVELVARATLESVDDHLYADRP